MTHAKKVDDEFVQIRPVIVKDKEWTRLMTAPGLTPSKIIIFFTLENQFSQANAH